METCSPTFLLSSLDLVKLRLVVVLVADLQVATLCMRFAAEESLLTIFPMSLGHPRLQHLQQFAVTALVCFTFTTFIRG